MAIYDYEGNEISVLDDVYTKAETDALLSGIIDPTLSIVGKAADAKVVGDDFTTIKSLVTETYSDAEMWAVGYWAVATGAITDSTGWCRTAQAIDDSIISFETSSPWKLFVLAYEGSTYIGTWFGSSWLKTYDATYEQRYVDMEWFRKTYPNYTFKLDFTKAQAANLSVNDCLTNIVVKKSVDKVQDRILRVKSGDIARPAYWENGTINSEGKKGADAATVWKRLSTNDYLQFDIPVTIIPKTGYAFSVTTYKKDKTLESQFTAWCESPYTFSNTEKLYKVVIKSTSNAIVLPANIANYIEAQILYSLPSDRILSECANVKVVNHRGYNFIAPENTIIAYEMSAQRGFKYVETDVLFTSDGVPVLLHDDTINRTARNADGSAISSTIYIENITYEQALTYDFGIYKGSQFAGTKIPTFAEFMYCCKAMNLHPWIELKWTHNYTLTEIQQIISIVKQYGMEEHVTFISFSYAALALVAVEWDTVELGLNGTVENAKLLRTGKNRVFMIYNQENSYADAISEGFEVCVYTVDTIAQLSALTNQGFDSILTNGLLQSQVCDVVRHKYEQANQ